MKITLEVDDECVSCETDFVPNKGSSTVENYEEKVKLFNKMFDECKRQMDRLMAVPVVHPIIKE